MNSDRNVYDSKTVLITGGTGSFGHAMAARLLTAGCKEIRVFSRDEAKQEEMRRQLREGRLRFFIGDVRDRSSLDRAMRGVDLVFHAAALKQVPSCEFFPIEAVRTNVLGSQHTISSAIDAGVRNVVCLGTDKAVYPINAMGMTKALMEKTAQAASRPEVSGDTTICTVRYGNVMYSRGSVIPLFVRQIQAGEPLTVTHPEMTRFLLRMSDALDLVTFAFEHGRAGDVLIKKAPACTVATLAEALMAILRREVAVETIGVRHGEKMHETLAAGLELVSAEDHGDYLRVPMDTRDLNYDLYFRDGIHAEVPTDYTSENAQRLDADGVVRLLEEIPEIRGAAPR